MALRLTTFTDYSLRVLLYLAAAPGGRSTIAEIAAAYGISEQHLVKVVHRLGKEGFLINTRGRRGGLRLARPAGEISVAAVVRGSAGADLPAECFHPASNTCMLAGGCRLQNILGEALEKFYETLGKYSVADLTVAPVRLRRLLRFHSAQPGNGTERAARERG